PLPGAQKSLRVDRLAIDAGLVVQMRPGGAAGRANLADDLAAVHRLADLDVDAGQVAVAGREAMAGLDFDHVSVAPLPAGEGHRAIGGGAYRLADVAAHVDAGVKCRGGHERIDAHAESRRRVDLARDRLADWDIAQASVEPVELRAHKADALDLMLEALN